MNNLTNFVQITLIDNGFFLTNDQWGVIESYFALQCF